MAWFRQQTRDQIGKANFSMRPPPVLTPKQRVQNAHEARRRNQARRSGS
jgi:hypothetical protein